MLREKPLVLLIHDALGDKNGTSSRIHKPCSYSTCVLQACYLYCMMSVELLSCLIRNNRIGGKDIVERLREEASAARSQSNVDRLEREERQSVSGYIAIKGTRNGLRLTL